VIPKKLSGYGDAAALLELYFFAAAASCFMQRATQTFPFVICLVSCFGKGSFVFILVPVSYLARFMTYEIEHNYNYNHIAR